MRIDLEMKEQLLLDIYSDKKGGQAKKYSTLTFFQSPDDVAKMGIPAYNGECRKIVTRYASEWEAVVGRMGRWIDFKNDYKSMYPW